MLKVEISHTPVTPPNFGNDPTASHLKNILRPPPYNAQIHDRRFIDIAGGAPLKLIPITSASSVWLGLNSGLILIYVLNQKLCIQETHSIQAHPAQMSCMILVDDKYVWTCSESDPQISIFETTRGIPRKLSTNIFPFRTNFEVTKYSVNPTIMVYTRGTKPAVWIGSGNGILCVVHAITCQTLQLIETNFDSPISGMIQHKDMVLVSNRGSVHLFSVENYTLFGSFEAHTTILPPMKMISVGDYLWTATSKYRVWYFPSPDDISIQGDIRLHDGHCNNFYLENGDLYSVSATGELNLWDTDNRMVCQEIIMKYGLADMCIVNGYLWCVSVPGEMFVLSNPKQLHPVLRRSSVHLAQYGEENFRELLKRRTRTVIASPVNVLK